MSTQRVVALVGLLVLGVLSLPLVATFLDGEEAEDLIIPAQLVLMALAGALIGRFVPALAGPGSSRGRAMVVGAAVGVGAALVGGLIFFLLLSGLDGA